MKKLFEIEISGRMYDVAEDGKGERHLVGHCDPDAYGRPVAYKMAMDSIVADHGGGFVAKVLANLAADLHAINVGLRQEVDRLSAAVSRSES